MIRFFRKYHKLLGLFFSLFLFMFALSGIVLNHRKFFSRISVSRNILPPNYRFDNWNNGSLKGAFQLSDDTIIIYGGAGMWLTNPSYNTFEAFTLGLKKGVDSRNTGRIVPVPL